MWRYASKNEFGLVSIACLLALPILSLINISNQYIFQTSLFPFRVIFIDLLLSIILIGGLRAILTALYSYLVEKNAHNNNSEKKRVLIIGAGETGNIIANEVSRNPNSRWFIIGFIDDKKELTGRKIHQKPVLGTTNDLTYHIKKQQIEEIIIAMPTASTNTIRKIIDIANQNNIKCQTTQNYQILLKVTSQ